MKEIVILLVIVLVVITPPTAAAKCKRKKNCDSCATARGCVWCPLESKCYGKRDNNNPCLNVQNINKPGQCYSTAPPEAYDPEEAERLVVLSAVGYSETPDVCLKKLDLNETYEVLLHEKARCNDFWLLYDYDCQALVLLSHANQEIVVTFSGSQGMEQIIDQFISITLFGMTESIIGGKTQAYFQNVNDKFINNITAVINETLLANPNYNVTFTGHSLGAAVASIASAEVLHSEVVHKDKVSLYTFGQPRVGEKLNAGQHDKTVPNSWNIMQQKDLVTDFPQCGLINCHILGNVPYHHGNKVLYSATNINATSPYSICLGNEDGEGVCKKKGFNYRKVTRKTLVEYHTVYFGIHVGQLCENLNNSTKNSTISQ